MYPVKQRTRLAALLLLAALLTAWIPAPAAPAVNGITVATTEELNSILRGGTDLSNTTILLTGDSYVIDTVFSIHDVSGLTIRGDGRTQIISTSLDDFVFWIDGCRDITLDGLVLGHDPLNVDVQNCKFGVVHLLECQQVTIANCEIFGCGLMGIEADTSSLDVRNTVIRDCSMHAVSGLHTDSHYTNCEFYGNGYYYTSEYCVADGVFENCYFHNNKNLVRESDYQYTSTSFVNCRFYGNAWGGDNISGPAETTFTDVPKTHWAYSDIERAVQLGLLNGTGNSQFSPGVSLSNAMFAAMLTRGFFREQVDSLTPPGGDSPWYRPNMAVAISRGLMYGTACYAGNATENDSITRYDMAVMISNLFSALDWTVSSASIESARNAVGDWNAIPAQYQNAVAVTYAAGIIHGTPDGTFSGGNLMDRASAAAVLIRLIDCRDSGGPAAFSPPQSAAAAPSEAEVTSLIAAQQANYPEGMPWDNSSFYSWKGGIYDVGFGCAGFAFAMSDAAFGDLPARKLDSVSFSQVRPGDILRLQGDVHSVIVLEKNENGVTIAEGNYNRCVHWGRSLSIPVVESSVYMLTRYPA